MFECKYPLLEVIQAIEKIREAKGPTEMEVLDYVTNHVRKPDDPVKVLKTIRTLKKLVEEGVLVQKGKRYMFSPNSQESSEKEDEEEDCEGENDSNMEGEDGEGEEEDCEEEEEEEEDDDDDDDEDEEEDDDDDDDSEECDDKETLPEGEKAQPAGGEDKTIKTISKNKNFMSPSKANENMLNKVSSTSADVPKCAKSAHEKNGGKNMIKGNKTNTVIDQKSGDGKNKGGEAIAFCARDFIDSQYRPQSGGSCHIDPSKSEEMPQDSLATRSEKLPFESNFSRGKRFSRMKRGQMSDSKYRSRSPIRGMKPELYGSLRLDNGDEIGSISSQLFHEPADAEMEVDGGKDGEATGVDFDIYRHRSPLGPPPPNTPGVHVDREESCCSNFEVKPQNEIKLEPNFEEYSLKKDLQSGMSQGKFKDSQCKWSGDAEKRPDKHKRGLSSDDDKNLSDDARESLCAVCEKKKRNS